MPESFPQITSLNNPRIKQVKKLRKKREREREKLFVVDSLRDLERALANDYRIAYGLYCPERLPTETILNDIIQGQQIYEVPPNLLDHISYRENPEGLVAVLYQPPPQSIEELHGATSPRILALVNLKKPGNIGALLRTADGAGFRTIFLIDTELDLYNPNLIRSSTGACFLNNSYTGSSEQALRYFTAQSYTMIAAQPDAKHSIYDVNLADKIALILGTEDTGLNERWMTNCDRLLSIPMIGRLSDSLNVSVAGAILMYEALRQHHSQ